MRSNGADAGYLIPFSGQPTKIDWKDEAKNLTKLYPRIVNPEDPDEVEEPGSFFHLFESEAITQEVSWLELDWITY